MEVEPSITVHRSVVLLVDDQPIVAEAIRQMLADQPDIEFHYCSEPEKAVATAQEIGATVVLQDLVMPGIDGLTVVRAFRATPRLAWLPIVVLSTKEHPLDKSAAFAAGGTDYLVKLPDKIELIARLRAHSKSWHAQLERDEAYRSLRAMKRRLEESNESLRRLTNLDGLTGIANRRRFDEMLDQEWRRSQRLGTEVSLILIDIDLFKLFNDSCGHLEGDECLRQVAVGLQSGALRPTDLVSRYGGEEFAALLPDTPALGACQVAERLQAAIAALALAHPAAPSGFISISQGVATRRPLPHTDPALLIAEADAALYRAKRNGRSRYHLYQDAAAS